jgi:hypothetical protein
MKKLFLIFILLAAVGARAEQTFKYPEFLAMENFSVAKKDGRVHVGFDYVIKNPNWYNIVIMPSMLALKIAETDCGQVEVQNKVKLLGKETRGYHFVLVGDESQFAKSTFSSIWEMMSGNGIAFNIAGNLKAGVFIMRPKWAVDYTYRMTMDEFLSFF